MCTCRRDVEYEYETNLRAESPLNLYREKMEDSQALVLWGWERFFGEIETFLVEANRRFETSSPEFAEHVVERLDIVVRALSTMNELLEEQEDEDLVVVQGVIQDITVCCQSLRLVWQSFIDSIDDELTSAPLGEGYHVPRVIDGCGRPRAVISQEQLLYLRSLNFSWTNIADILGVSRATIFRRRRELGLQESDIMRPMDDVELRMFVGQVREEFPNIGESLVIARLHSVGYHVPRARVRSAIRITDPINTALRWRGISTIRRPYSVAGPNSLWHIGNTRFIQGGYSC